MTWHQAFIFASTVILLGSLGLLAIAVAAARAGVMSAAIFIGACGLMLLAPVPIAIFGARPISPRGR